MMPQILVLILLSLNLGAAVIGHGRETKVNAYVTAFDMAATLGLLAWGGFF
jgi:hypothetical protein